MKTNHKNDHTLGSILDHYREAVITGKRLPSVQVQGFFSTWPELMHTAQELMMMEVRPIRLQATSDAISRLEQALEWMHWLTVLERKILWLRAGKKPWKKIREDYGISQATASRRLNSALTKISYRLNNPEKYEKCEQS